MACGNKKSERNRRNKGYEYEDHLILHTCISLKRLQCQDFSVLPEDKSLLKFDDIVCKYKYGGKIYMIAIQSKTAGREKSLTEIVLKENKDYKLDQYIEAIGEIQKSLSDCEIFFILITPRKMSMKILPYLISSSSAINVITEVFADMFKDLKETKALQFNYELLKQILPNFTDDLLKYAHSKLIFITEAPNVNDLEMINYKLLFGEHTDITVDPTKSIVKFIENSETNEEATITKEKFNILLSALFEKDLTKISEDFLKNEYPLFVNFNENYLNQVNDKLKTCNFIKSYENIKLHALIVLQCVRKFDSNALFIRITKLKDFHLELIERNIVILIDEEMSCKYLIKKPNIYYVGKIIMDVEFNTKLPSFSYDSLSLNSKRNFESKYIYVQGYKVSFKKIKDLSNEYESIMTSAFVDLFNGKTMKFDGSLSKNINIHPHVERDFSIGYRENNYYEKEKQIVLEKNIIKSYNRCIITGDPGIGKSFTLMNMITNFKKNSPEYLVKFFDLKLIHIFLTRFCKEESLDNFIKNINNKLLLIKFLIFEENHKKKLLINSDFIEYYLSLKESHIIIIFDGFDEIMPTYSNIILELVKKLIILNVKIFISGRSHSYEELKNLENFVNLTINPYSNDQVNSFIEKYIKYIIIKQKKNNFLNVNHIIDSLISAITICSHNNNSLKYTPLYLKMFIDIYIEDYRNIKNTNIIKNIKLDLYNLDILTLYDKIFEIAFNNYYEKEGINSMSNTAIFQKRSKIRQVQKMYGRLAYEIISSESILMGKCVDDAFKSKDLDEMEILGRGFVKRLSSKELYFIHRTFAEYFLASYLFDNFIENNIFERVNDSIYEQLIPFICPMLIRRLKNTVEDKIGLETDNMMRVFPEKDNIKDQLKFSLLIIMYCWQYHTKEVPVILNFLFNNFQLKDLVENENLLKFDMSFQFNPIQQIYLTFTLRGPKYSDCKLLGKISKYLELKLISLMSSDYIHFESFLYIYYNYINRFCIDKSRFIKLLLTHNVITKKIGDYNGNATDKIIWCIWKNIYLSNDPILKCREINKILEALNKEDKENKIIEFIMLAINGEILNNSFNKSTTFNKFIENILLFSINSGNFYEFLMLLNSNSCVFSTMLSHDIKFSGKISQIFILPDNNSLLYHLCFDPFDKYEYCLLDVMKFFSKNENVLDDLLNGPYFKGKSFEIFYKSYILSQDERNICLEILNTSSHFIKGYDTFKKILSVYNEKTNIYEAIKHDLKILYFLSLYLYKLENKRAFELSNNYMSKIQNIIRFFGNNLLKLKKENAFLCDIARITECDILNRNDGNYILNSNFNPYKNILYNFFALFDFNDKLLLHYDSDGNNPVLVCALENNFTFLEVIYNCYLPSFDSMFEVRNKKKQNFFHCIRTNDVRKTLSFIMSLGFNKYFTSFNGKIKLNQLIVQKDIYGRTPLHRSENLEYFLHHLLNYINDDTFINLFKIKDKEGYNIIHYLSMHKNDQQDNRDPTYTIWPLKLLSLPPRSSVVPAMKDALISPNKNTLTPLDICRTCKICTKETLLEPDTYCGKLSKDYDVLLKDLDIIKKSYST